MSESCNFCGKKQHEVKKLLIGEMAGICNECINLAGEILLREIPKDVSNVITTNPIEIKEHLDKFIVSQDSAKEILSVAVANHCKRISHLGNSVEKSNVMLLGPTGSGKTMLVKTMADYLQMPYAIVDATRLTEAGYFGDDVDSLLAQLLHRAGGNVQSAQHGIIFIDEIDKIAKQGSGEKSDIGGEGVQQSLLKLVEGATFHIAKNKRSDETIEINTKNILFIASGSFTGLNKIKRKKKIQTRIGFSADVKQKKAISSTEFDDLVAFGMIPEFVGRFPIIAEVTDLSKTDMLNILSNIENSLVTQYTHLFDYDNIKLEFEDDALTQVVQIAKEKKAGARGLKAIMEKALLPHMYNMRKYINNDINSVVITKQLVSNPAKLVSNPAKIKIGVKKG